MDVNDISVNNTFNYFSIENFNSSSSFFNLNDLMMLNLNIRSFQANYDYLAGFLDNLSFKPQVLLLTETWFSRDNVQEIEMFNSYHVYRNGRSGGGTSIYISKLQATK